MKELGPAVLRARTGYSLLRGTLLPEPLVALAARAGHRAVALTDVNSLAAAPAFVAAARAAGLTPLVGAELRLRGGAALALVEDREGYGNLCELITAALAAESAEAPPETLAAKQGHLQWLALHADSLRALKDAGVAAPALGIDPAAFGETVTRAGLDIARRLGATLVAVGSALHRGPEDFDLLRLLAAIRDGRNFADVTAGDLPPATAGLRRPARLRRECAAWPGARSANAAVVERCGGFRLLPEEPVFPRFPCPDGLAPAAWLRQLCEAGLPWRYGAPSAAVRARLDHELAVIERLGFVEYFLVVWDLVQFARRRGAPVAGRGSGASSIVAYLLGITNICPLRYRIPFERFLHDDREDFPDLDVDFCWRLRDEVIAYVFDRWGADHTAMVCMYNCFQRQSAWRETLKAFGVAEGDLGGLDPDRAPAAAKALAPRLLGLPHVLSVHPGGTVISPGPMARHAPLQQAAKGVPVTQFDKDGIAAMRLVKLDILGNRMLSTVREACVRVAAGHGRELDIDRLPEDDPETLALLHGPDTIGCNQLESPAMRHLLAMTRPQGLGDLTRTLALIRPGAAKNGMKEQFVRRMRGLEQAPPGHPRVAAVLSDTHGIMVYEDDVMRVAAALLDIPLSAADRFRRAICKTRDPDARAALREDFLARCVANGVCREEADWQWRMMSKFTSYSFCRAHAASYAKMAWAGAWLKAHYPAEFWVAALNNNQSMYHPRVYIEHAKRQGITVLLPDVNAAGAEFELEGGAIRIGLNRVAGLGPEGVGRLLAAQRAGPFAGVADCRRRSGLGSEEMAALIRCGAADALIVNRPTALLELRLGGDRPASALALPGFEASVETTVLPAYDDRRKLLEEWQLLGLGPGPHPLALYRNRLAGQTDADSRAIPGSVGRHLRLAGMIETCRHARTAKGDSILFLSFADEYGIFEVFVGPRLCPRGVDDLAAYGPYRIEGRVEDKYGSRSLVASQAPALLR